MHVASEKVGERQRVLRTRDRESPDVVIYLFYYFYSLIYLFIYLTIKISIASYSCLGMLENSGSVIPVVRVTYNQIVINVYTENTQLYACNFS